MKTSTDRLIYQLRSSGRFVFCYKLNNEELQLPESHQRARLKVNFEKAVQAFFESRPSLINNSNEVDRF